MKRTLFAIPSALVAVALFLSPLAAQGAGPKGGTELSTGTSVLASTSWTAAIARAAGAASVNTLAPAELRHPPEYEPTPSDLVLARDATLLVYAGYEKFAQRILEASGNDGAKALKVSTDNRPETLIAESRKVAEKLGTVAAQEAWAKGFLTYAQASRARLGKALGAKRVAVQAQLKVWMEWMGFAVVGTFGPGEPSPAQMLELLKAKPDLVIDNYHNPSGQGLAESLRVPYALLINFPGQDGTLSLEDVYAYDERALLGSAGR